MRNGNAMNGNGATRAPVDQPEVISEVTAGRLRRLAGRIPPDELSEIWVFPPLQDVEGSDEFHLFTRRMSEGVYRVCAAEFPGEAKSGAAANGPAASAAASNGAAAAGSGQVEAAAGEPRVTVYGAVPESRVPRLVAGFRDRLGDGREPLYLPIYGSLERWRLVVGADPEAAGPDDASGPDGPAPDAAPDETPRRPLAEAVGV